MAQALPAAGAGISSPEVGHLNPGYATLARFKGLPSSVRAFRIPEEPSAKKHPGGYEGQDEMGPQSFQ